MNLRVSNDIQILYYTSPCKHDMDIPVSVVIIFVTSYLLHWIGHYDTIYAYFLTLMSNSISNLSPFLEILKYQARLSYISRPWGNQREEGRWSRYNAWIFYSLHWKRSTFILLNLTYSIILALIHIPSFYLSSLNHRFPIPSISVFHKGVVHYLDSLRIRAAKSTHRVKEAASMTSRKTSLVLSTTITLLRLCIPVQNPNTWLHSTEGARYTDWFAILSPFLLLWRSVENNSLFPSLSVHI